MTIVVTGLIGQYPLGGVVWDYIQYLLGFRALGHDVYYLEDSGAWPYDPVNQTVTDDCSYTVSFLEKIFSEFGFSGKWIYRNAADGTFHGAGEQTARELLKTADVLLNVSTASWFEDYEISVRHKIYIDTDPLFTQIRLQKDDDYSLRLKEHDRHFTFGLKIGDADCLAPETGIRWRPTIQPVALEEWPFEPDVEDNGAFTTVMNWASFEPVSWNGQTYGQKDVEFLKFLDLPTKTDAPFHIVLGQGVGRQRPTEQLTQNGWHILEPENTVAGYREYRDFLKHSKAEWSIAKHGYVSARTGWFSCRSACYLALGRPILVQDTGWSEKLAHGEGLLPFSTQDECLQGVEELRQNYPKHRLAARRLAEEHLDARKVCSGLLEGL